MVQFRQFGYFEHSRVSALHQLAVAVALVLNACKHGSSKHPSHHKTTLVQALSYVMTLLPQQNNRSTTITTVQYGLSERDIPGCLAAINETMVVGQGQIHDRTLSSVSRISPGPENSNTRALRWSVPVQPVIAFLARRTTIPS